MGSSRQRRQRSTLWLALAMGLAVCAEARRSPSREGGQSLEPPKDQQPSQLEGVRGGDKAKQGMTSGAENSFEEAKALAGAAGLSGASLLQMASSSPTWVLQQEQQGLPETAAAAELLRLVEEKAILDSKLANEAAVGRSLLMQQQVLSAAEEPPAPALGPLAVPLPPSGSSFPKANQPSALPPTTAQTIPQVVLSSMQGMLPQLPPVTGSLRNILIQPALGTRQQQQPIPTYQQLMPWQQATTAMGTNQMMGPVLVRPELVAPSSSRFLAYPLQQQQQQLIQQQQLNQQQQEQLNQQQQEQLNQQLQIQQRQQELMQALQQMQLGQQQHLQVPEAGGGTAAGGVTAAGAGIAAVGGIAALGGTAGGAGTAAGAGTAGGGGTAAGVENPSCHLDPAPCGGNSAVEMRARAYASQASSCSCSRAAFALACGALLKETELRASGALSTTADGVRLNISLNAESCAALWTACGASTEPPASPPTASSAGPSQLQVETPTTLSGAAAAAAPAAAAPAAAAPAAAAPAAAAPEAAAPEAAAATITPSTAPEPAAGAGSSHPASFAEARQRQQLRMKLSMRLGATAAAAALRQIRSQKDMQKDVGEALMEVLHDGPTPAKTPQELASLAAFYADEAAAAEEVQSTSSALEETAYTLDAGGDSSAGASNTAEGATPAPAPPPPAAPAPPPPAAAPAGGKGAAAETKESNNATTTQAAAIAAESLVAALKVAGASYDFCDVASSRLPQHFPMGGGVSSTVVQVKMVEGTAAAVPLELWGSQQQEQQPPPHQQQEPPQPTLATPPAA